MEADYRCFFCFARAIERLVEKQPLSIKDKKRLTAEMFSIFRNIDENFSVPELSRDLFKLFGEKSGNADPYQEIKFESNRVLLENYEILRSRIDNSKNRFETALRLAIAGNIIDYGVSDTFDLDQTIELVEKSRFSIDHVDRLEESIKNAKTILWLGDNAGEIVFDKLFIETLQRPDIWYAVRGAPTINDATRDDAIQVNMGEVARVIDNGYDAPSTIVDKCSSRFQELFNSADLVISKGQGNLEGLIDHQKRGIYFLLMVKCDVIADRLGVKKGGFVCASNDHREQQQQ